MERSRHRESFWVIKRWQRYKKRLGLRESESTGERAGLAGSCTEDRERPLWTLTVIKGLCEYFDTFTRTARASSLQIYLSRSPQSLEQPFYSIQFKDTWKQSLPSSQRFISQFITTTRNNLPEECWVTLRTSHASVQCEQMQVLL